MGQPWGEDACYLHTEIGVWLQRLELLWSLQAEGSPSVPCIPLACPGSTRMLTCPVTGCCKPGRAWHGAAGAGLQQGTSSAGRSQGAETKQVNVCPTSCSTSWVCTHSRSHAAASAWGEGSVCGFPRVLVHHHGVSAHVSVSLWMSHPSVGTMGERAQGGTQRVLDLRPDLWMEKREQKNDLGCPCCSHPAGPPGMVTPSHLPLCPCSAQPGSYLQAEAGQHLLQWHAVVHGPTL